ncbi:unnamed protein product [Rhizophagus irregularis]|nr:unnamed protein product [Rhizophagus irregularis]
MGDQDDKIILRRATAFAPCPKPVRANSIFTLNEIIFSDLDNASNNPFATRKYLEGAWLNNSSKRLQQHWIGCLIKQAVENRLHKNRVDMIEGYSYPGIAFSWIFTCTIKTALFCSKRKDPEPCL